MPYQILIGDYEIPYTFPFSHECGIRVFHACSVFLVLLSTMQNWTLATQVFYKVLTYLQYDTY